MKIYSDRFCNPDLRIPGKFKVLYEVTDWHLAFVAELTREDVERIGGGLLKVIKENEKSVPDKLHLITYYDFDSKEIPVLVEGEEEYAMTFPVLEDIELFVKTMDEGPESIQIAVEIWMRESLWEELS